MLPATPQESERTCMRIKYALIASAVALVLPETPVARLAAQTPPIRAVDEKLLKEYAAVYRWDKDAFLYLQLWSEFTGTNQLVAFDESGEVRTLYPMDRDRFFAGPGAAVPTARESRIEFQRDGA